MPLAPQVTPEHERLAALDGEWAGEEMVGASRWFAAGPARGHVSARIGLDGFYLIQDYRQEREGRTVFSGHGLITFDHEDGRYKMLWHSSVGFVPESLAVGQWRDGELVLRRASLRGTVRQSFRLEGPDAYAMRLQFSPDDEGWSDLLTAAYRRVAA